MKTFLDCVPCFARQALANLRRATDDAAVHGAVLRKVLRLISDMDLSTSPPKMGQQILRAITEATGNADVFAEEKRVLNDYALSLVPDMRRICERECKDRFECLVRLSIAGNMIDLGVHGNVRTADILACVHDSMYADTDSSAVEHLRREVGKAQSILFLGDNAGEIVFDRLLMESMPYERVTYVVRGAPVINDVTLEDARQTGVLDLVRVIDNGSDAPGTILDDCSETFREAFEAADLVIAKGQGNYETLSDADKNAVFLLQAKCPVIARDAGCETGAFIVKVNRKARRSRACVASV
jgi:uncharacterized protein with ATP-grasp and redox domains